MARPGTLRHHKVLSSGRLTGAAKLTSGKKQIGLRKACQSDVDSGYSLYSTDSEDQVATIHNGLDRCAALLHDILQNEATGMETVHRKPGKATSVKATTRTILAKGNSSKKKGLKKNVLAAHIHKEIVPVSNRKPASCNTPAVDKEGELSSAVQNQPVQPIHVPFNQQSPVMHQKLCEHVQTQMSLITGQVPQSSTGIPTVPAYPVSDPGYQSVTAFNYRLPTSTPTLSPQHSTNPLIMQSGVPADSYNQHAPQAGGAVFFPVVSAAAAATSAQAQSVPTGPCMIPCVPPAVPNNSTASTFLPGSYGREMISNQGNHEQRVKEADLIRCIQAHLALLEPHEAESDRAGQKYQKFDSAQSKISDTKEEETAEEHSEGTTSEEEDLNAVDIAPVRETSCQTSIGKKILKPKKASPEKTAQKVKTVKYLLGELKALADQDDSETLRLISEIEDCVSLLPAVVGSTNVQAEIALAIQPLRSENAQLRRRLRIMNQQLRERERAEKESSLDCNFELVSLQSLNMSLQSQLKESLKGLESLHSKNEELLKIIENQKEENKQFAKVIQDKDKELLENKQQYDIEATKLKIVDDALANVKSFRFKLEASEKENQILGITLRQRDAEVNRLRELTRTLQSSMAKLLSDLTVDNVRHRPEKGLTKSLLEDYEKQLKPNPFPVSTSIMSYLQKLESDQILTNTEPQFSDKNGALEMPGLACEKFVAEGSPKRSTLLTEEITAPRILPTLSKQDAETISDSGTLIEEEHKLDETIYIPLTRSASKKQPSISERRMCAQHQVSVAPKKLDYNSGLSDSQKQNGFGMLDDKKIFDKFRGGYDLRETENTSETTEKTTELDRDKLLLMPKEIIGAAKDFIAKSDRPQSDKYLYTCMPHQKESFQKTSEMSDSTFSPFDCMSGKSEWSMSSFSTFTSRDEEDFKNGLAALDANIARLQRTLQTGIMKQ
ncbi:coiled-coil domain-containing protein 14 isoform X2 [Emydura macquarii macquarii]|uniref:coiled-coil domain-containing protein 14 isoform X2 n=1 Tax=Emydura macquarii macquarii TaxID=1129001 RepID=UPI00352AF461